MSWGYLANPTLRFRRGPARLAFALHHRGLPIVPVNNTGSITDTSTVGVSIVEILVGIQSRQAI